MPRVTVLILSHRPHMVGDAERSVYENTYYKKNPLDVQVLTQHCGDYWYGKLNEIASIARGEFLVILCDDDALGPTFLEEMLRVADVASPAPDMLYGDRIAWKDEGPRKWWNPRTWRRQRAGDGIYFGNWGPSYTQDALAHVALIELFTVGIPNKGYFRTPVPPAHFATGHWLPMTCMIRKSFWDEMRGYNDSVSHADTEFWFRAAKRAANFAYVPGRAGCFYYRQHEGQFSQESPSLENAMREFSRAHFDEFGLMWECAEEIEQTGAFTVPMVPKHLRAIVRDHLRSLEAAA